MVSSVVPPVGASVPRVDGVAKVTGRARYLDDLDAPGAWHGATVRSTVPHGVLEGFDLDPAFDWSKVVFATAEDIPGENMILLIEKDQPALVAIGKRVMHVDEALGVVAAPTRAMAFEALKFIKPRITSLPPIFTVEDALAAKVKLYGDDNVFKKFLIRKGHATDTEIEAVFAGAHKVIDGSYYTSPQEQMYIEPQAMMAVVAAVGAVYIVGSMQCPYYVHKAMKPLLDRATPTSVVDHAVGDRRRVRRQGGVSLDARRARGACVAHKAKRRKVKMVYDRDEDIAATTKRHPCVDHAPASRSMPQGELVGDRRRRA